MSLVDIDDELNLPLKIEAAKDGITMKKLLSDLIRQELNRRWENILKIKPDSSD